MGSTKEHYVLTKAKLTSIVQEVENTKDVKITKLGVDAASGQNYTGEIVFCSIEADVGGKNKSYEWAVKLPPASMDRRPTNRAIRVEEKEHLFYKEVLPAWKKLIADRKAGFEINCLDSPYSEYNQEMEKGSVIVMRNLAKMGYEEAEDKKKGLRLGYAKLALEELAKFHALGYAYLQSYPGGVEEGLKSNEVFATDYAHVNKPEHTRKFAEGFRGQMVDTMVNVLAGVQEPGQDFVGAFEKFNAEHDAPTLRDRMGKADPAEFNTLCHGDAHFNNILFLHEKNGEEEKIPVAASWLDVSVTSYASPCTDLARFFYWSTSCQLRRTHLDRMLGHYHDALTRCLSALGHDPTVYPFRHLKRDFDKYSVLGFVMALWALPALLLDKEDQITQEDMAIDWTDPAAVDAMMKKVHVKLRRGCRNTPEIKNIMAGNFLDMIDRGFIKVDDV